MIRNRPSPRQLGLARSITVPEKWSDRKAYLRLRVLELADDAELAEADARRPRTRSECVGGMRPCPWVSCRHHLAIDITEAGALKLNHADVDVMELAETCSLDVADRGGVTYEALGDLLNVSRERVRQVETKSLQSARNAAMVDGLDETAIAGFASPAGAVEPDHDGVGMLREHFANLKANGVAL